MKESVVLVDLDNTLFNLIDGLDQRFEWYVPSKQTEYSFHNLYPEHSNQIYTLFSDVEFFTSLKPLMAVYNYVIHKIQLGYTVNFFSNKATAMHTEFYNFFQSWSQDTGLSEYYIEDVPLYLWDSHPELAKIIDSLKDCLVEVVDDYPDKLDGLITDIYLTVPSWPYNKKSTYIKINPRHITYIDLGYLP